MDKTSKYNLWAVSQRKLGVDDSGIEIARTDDPIILAELVRVLCSLGNEAPFCIVVERLKLG